MADAGRSRNPDQPTRRARPHQGCRFDSAASSNGSRTPADADYTYSEKQAIPTIISRSPGELAVFRRSHRTCSTLLELRTKMAAEMNDARSAPSTGINALLAAAENQQHPEHARLLAAFRTLFPAGDRDDRPSRERRMIKPAGPPTGRENYCNTHGWVLPPHDNKTCRAQHPRCAGL